MVWCGAGQVLQFYGVGVMSVVLGTGLVVGLAMELSMELARC